jgi:hypothetical protein
MDWSARFTQYRTYVSLDDNDPTGDTGEVVVQRIQHILRFAIDDGILVVSWVDGNWVFSTTRSAGFVVICRPPWAMQ